MNAVDIDVSKEKRTIAVIRPSGEVCIPPFDVLLLRKKLGKAGGFMI